MFRFLQCGGSRPTRCLVCALRAPGPLSPKTGSHLHTPDLPFVVGEVLGRAIHMALLAVLHGDLPLLFNYTGGSTAMEGGVGPPHHSLLDAAALPGMFVGSRARGWMF